MRKLFYLILSYFQTSKGQGREKGRQGVEEEELEGRVGWAWGVDVEEIEKFGGSVEIFRLWNQKR